MDMVANNPNILPQIGTNVSQSVVLCTDSQSPHGHSIPMATPRLSNEKGDVVEEMLKMTQVLLQLKSFFVP